ncbi:hypothetical protein [Silvanigrella sp.]|jgi:hypothetical protein|uniref:hypothetical protein n=1 Tax=Silvanigrella sp. TaxID=2024976 RepID=UPI0037CAB41B
MKNIFTKCLFIILFFYPLKIYSQFIVSIVNRSVSSLDIVHPEANIFVTNLFRGSTPLIEIKNTTHLLLDEFFNIQNDSSFYIDQKKYKINIFYSSINECSWIHTFGIIKKPHGFGLTVYINDKESGTICANKYSILDFQVNSILEFYKTNENKKFLKFSNTGWWENNTVYPTSIDIKLD